MCAPFRHGMTAYFIKRVRYGQLSYPARARDETATEGGCRSPGRLLSAKTIAGRHRPCPRIGEQAAALRGDPSRTDIQRALRQDGSECRIQRRSASGRPRTDYAPGCPPFGEGCRRLPTRRVSAYILFRQDWHLFASRTSRDAVPTGAAHIHQRVIRWQDELEPSKSTIDRPGASAAPAESGRMGR